MGIAARKRAPGLGEQAVSLRGNGYPDQGKRNMAQPVIDTLAVADALERTGMEREQAKGLARTLGTELGDHVAVQSDLEAGFDGIRGQMDTRFAHIDARFAEVDARFAHVDARFVQVDARFAQVDARFVQVDARFAELEAKVDTIAADLRGDIKALGTRLEALGGQLKFGFGLLVGMLAVVMGMIGVLHAGA